MCVNAAIPFLSHVNVHTLYCVNQEYLDGGTLEGLLAKQMVNSGPLYRLKDAVRWLKELATALKYIHGRQPMVSKCTCVNRPVGSSCEACWSLGELKSLKLHRPGLVANSTCALQSSRSSIAI